MGRALIIITVGFTTIFSGIIFNVSSTQQIITSDMNDLHEKWIAQNAAESITNVMMSKIYQSGFAATDTFYLDGIKGYANLTNITGDSVTEASTWLLMSMVEYIDYTDTTRTKFIYPSYSHYGYLLHGNTWPGHIIYATLDTLVGPLYGNPPIKISAGTPVFLSKVASTAGSFSGTGTPKTFGGIEFGTTAITPPNTSILAPIVAEANGAGHVFTSWSAFSDTLFLNFQSDSTYVWSEKISGNAGVNKTSDYNGLIMTQKVVGDFHIQVQGTVNGKITLISANDIIIENSLVCNNNPRFNANSQDLIGLIAIDDIIIPDNGINNINIQAALLAVGDFEVLGWNTSAYRGNLRLYGTMAVNDEHEAGNPIATGFNKVDDYDLRFRHRTPPYFPRVSYPSGVSPFNRKEILYRSN